MFRTGVLILAFVISSSAAAGPFGLEMGMSLDQLGITEKKATGGYTFPQVPQPHPAFSKYAGTVSPREGLCIVLARTPLLQTEIYGEMLQLEFHKLRERLEKVYGKHYVFDDLRAGSRWNQPRHWMMALLQKERTLSATWSEEKGSSLPADIEKIGLFAVARSRDAGYVGIRYQYKNAGACKAELEAGVDDAL